MGYREVTRQKIGQCGSAVSHRWHLPRGQHGTSKANASPPPRLAHLSLPSRRQSLGLFKIAICVRREASEPNRDLNGSGDTPPPHA